MCYIISAEGASALASRHAIDGQLAKRAMCVVSTSITDAAKQGMTNVWFNCRTFKGVEVYRPGDDAMIDVDVLVDKLRNFGYDVSPHEIEFSDGHFIMEVRW